MIEKGIPMPSRRPKTSRWAYIADQMEVGDSVLLEKRSRAASLAQAINNLYRGSSTDDAAAAVRAVEGGFRVWRTK